MTPTEQIITQPVHLTPFRVSFGSARNDNLKDVMLDNVTFDTRTVLMYDELGTPHAYDATTNTATALVAGSIRLKSHAYVLTITVEPYSGELRIN
jgi:hypothetical protein